MQKSDIFSGGCDPRNLKLLSRENFKIFFNPFPISSIPYDNKIKIYWLFFNKIAASIIVSKLCATPTFPAKIKFNPFPYRDFISSF